MNIIIIFRATTEEVVIQGLSYNLDAPLEVRDAGRKGRGVFATETIIYTLPRLRKTT